MSNGTIRPVLPALARFYPLLNEWAYLLLRITAGLMLIPHVWLKVGFGPTAVAANVMAKRGLEPALGFAYGAIIIESIAAFCITLGLFTRPAALLMVIEFVVITKSHFNSGGIWYAEWRRVRVPLAYSIHLHSNTRRRPVFGRCVVGSRGIRNRTARLRIV